MGRFSEASAVTPVGEGRFAVDIHPSWTIGGKPNGGYLLATLGRAAASVAPHPHPIAASTHYLRAPDPGPAVVEVEVLRAGRGASQARARLLQADTLCLEGLITLGTLDAQSTPHWSGAVPDAGADPFEQCVRVPSTSPSGLPVPMMDEVDLRISPGTLGFAAGQPSGAGELRGWLALLDGEAFDPVSLLYAVDSFPPATFEVELTGWVPTLELTVYVRALPAPGPLRVLHRAHLIDAQRVDEVCWVWDSTGRVVAHGTQLAAIRLG